MQLKNLVFYYTMSEKRPNIAFAGLTAAGKTTHAKLLADQLGYEYVSATQVLVEIMNLEETPDRLWFTKYDSIKEARNGDKLDWELEQRMKALIDERDGLVIDTWAMAWVYPGPLIRLWLESDNPSRARKCYVSQDEAKALDLGECQKLIDKKDLDTRNTLQRMHGYDLFTDRDRYNAILCNTTLIPEATDEAARQGIAAFAPAVFNVSSFLLRQVAQFANAPTTEIQDLRAKYEDMIIEITPTPQSFMHK